MGLSFLGFFKGIKLFNKNSSESVNSGEIENVNNKLVFHNGTSSSPIVTEAHNATLTNKTISGASNTLSNIPNNATTATSSANASTIMSRDSSADTSVHNLNSTKVVVTSGTGNGLDVSGTGDVELFKSIDDAATIKIGKANSVTEIVGASKIDSYIDFPETTVATNPGNGIRRVFTKSDGLLYTRDKDGIEALVAGTWGKIAGTLGDQTDLSNALSGKVSTGTTVNGHALSSNVSVTASDVGLGNVANVDTTNASNITQDSTHRFVSDTEKSTWNGKQDALGYTAEDVSHKDTNNGYPGLDANGLINIAHIPPAALERLIVVADQTARYALTTATAQNGDVVKQTDTGELFFIKDDTNLNNSSGYELFTSGTASSVPWSGVTGVPTASGSQSGILSSTDWTTFNNKVSSITKSTVDGVVNTTNDLFSVGASSGSTGGIKDTYVGYKAGNASDGTTDSCTLIGYEAGKLVTGDKNTIIGASNAPLLTSGNQNVLMGDSISLGATDGSSVGIGSGVTTTSYCVTIGAGASSSANLGIAIGNLAQSSGNYSLAIGKGASASNNGAVAIGTDSSNNGASATLTDEFVLGTANHAVKVPGTLSLSTALALGSGGTGATTKSTAFNALSPMSAVGDIIYGGTSGTGTALSGNTTTTKNFLSQTGTGSVSQAPAWSTLAKTDIEYPLMVNTSGLTLGSTSLASPQADTVAIGYGAGVGSTAVKGTYIGSGAIPNAAGSTYNTAVGYGAKAASYSVAVGASSVSSGTSSVAIGYGTQAAGSYFTAVGQGVGQNATGANNTGIGYIALNSASGANGADNTAVGYQSGGNATLTTGNKNTSVGSDSMRGISTGSENVAVGYRTAYRGPITKTQNTFVGSQAGIGSGSASYKFVLQTNYNVTAGAVYSNNSQNFTVAYGISPGNILLTNQATGAPLSSGVLTKVSGTGDSPINFTSSGTVYDVAGNTAIGAGAADGIQNGADYNVVIGQYAGRPIAGPYNVLIGTESGMNFLTGTGNVAIGVGAGKNYLTTGNHNILIGDHVDTGVGSNSRSGMVVIGADSNGNAAVGTADNDFVLGVAAHNIKIAGMSTITSMNMSSAGTMVTMASGTMTNTSGTMVGVQVTPVYNQSGGTSVVNTDLLINRTETNLGTTPGTQRLISAQVGSTEKFGVDNSGNVVASGYVSSSVITAQYKNTGSVAVTANQPIDFSTQVYDTYGRVTTGSGWKFTASVAGYYRITLTQTSRGSGTGNTILVYYNGNSGDAIGSYGVAAINYTMGTEIHLNVNDYIDLRCDGSITIIPGVLSITKIS